MSPSPSPRMCAAILLPAALALTLALVLAARGKPPPAPPDPPITVRVATVAPTEIAVGSQFPGRLAAYRQAEVRARAAGIVTARLYREGQEVKAGSPLFKIDPAALQAALDMRNAAYRQARAALEAAADKVRRYRTLIEADAVSRIDYAEALAAERQAAARVAEAGAALALDHTTVRAPIGGRARRALVTEGALVGQDSATPLTTIEQIDPIYVNFSQPAAKVAQLQKAIRAGELRGLPQKDIAVHLFLGDGSLYPQAGKLIFSDLAIDPATESVAMRAVMPNPHRVLLPGGYVRIALDQALNQSAILIPRDALLRTADAAKVLVVDARNIVQAVTVTADVLHGDRWLVSAGLSGGEKIIVANVAKIEPGALVEPREQDGNPGESAAENAAAGAAASAIPAIAAARAPPAATSHSH